MGILQRKQTEEPKNYEFYSIFDDRSYRDVHRSQECGSNVSEVFSLSLPRGGADPVEPPLAQTKMILPVSKSLLCLFSSLCFANGLEPQHRKKIFPHLSKKLMGACTTTPKLDLCQILIRPSNFQTTEPSQVFKGHLVK